MNTCATCKHWTPDESNAPLGACAAPAISKGYHHNPADIAVNGALVEADEGWGMLTGPQFGCVLHTMKE